MQNVLEVVERPNGGVKTHLKNFITCLTADEKSREFFFLGPQSNAEDFKNVCDSNLFISSHFDRSNKVNFIKSVDELKRFVEKHDIRIIHAHSSFSGILVSLFQHKWDRDKSIKYIYTPHAYYSEKPMSSWKRHIVQLFERRMLNTYQFVFHVSEEEQHFAEAQSLINPEKQQPIVIKNGLLDDLDQSDDTFDIDKTTVVMVGRADRQKNPYRFIALANKIHDLLPDERFVYVGGGPLLEHLRDISNNISYINFVGQVESVDEYLTSCQIFVSTSYYEGLPYAVLEAMRRGRPLFLSNVVGHRELVRRDNGIMFSLSESDESVAKKFSDFVSNRRDLLKCAKASRDIFLGEYTADNMTKKILNVYNTK